MANNSSGPEPPLTGTQKQPLNALLTGPDAQGMIGHVPPAQGYGSRPLTINGVKTPKLGIGGGVPK